MCLYGTVFAIKLRNKMTQKAIARECAEWVKKNEKQFNRQVELNQQLKMRTKKLEEIKHYQKVVGSK